MKRIILVLAAIISLFASLSLAEEEYISISSDTLVYYAEDETHYHLDPGCCIMPGESLRSNSFTYAERDTNAYRDMLPCEICTAPLIQSKKPHFSTFEEAIDKSNAIYHKNYCAAVAEKGGRNYRVFAFTDDHAKELYAELGKTKNDPDQFNAAFDILSNYCNSLPVSYDEEITAAPVEQAELDTLAGKTLEDVHEEGYELYYWPDHVCGDTVSLLLEHGFFSYEFTINESGETYLEHLQNYCFDDLTVKSVQVIGYSASALSPLFHPDGTVIDQAD